MSLIATLAALSCGGAPAGKPAGAPPRPAAAAPAVDAPPPAPERPALAAIPDDAASVVYLSGERLRASSVYEVYRQVMASDVPELRGFRASWKELIQRCGFDPVEVVQEIAVSARASAPDGLERPVLAVALDRPPAAAVACIESFFEGATRTSVAGAPAVRLPSGAVAASAGRLMLVGAEPAVAQAAARVASGAPASLPPRAAGALAERRGAVLVAVVDLAAGGDDVVESATVALESDAAHTALRAEVDARTEALASDMAATVDAILKQPAVAQGLPGVRATKEGRRLTVEVRADGDVATQAATLGTLAALGVHGVRKYLASAKAAEAKTNVSSIATLLAAHVLSMPPAKRRMPASAPPTPSAVPSGTKHIPTEQDWSHPTWKALRFDVREPSYYSYEILTAKDGRSAVVRATGDLDADGVFSRFSLPVTLKKDGSIDVPQELQIENELE
ncbi:hypothetical protein [Sorangium sp. So ce131]|uniref:hypothetical protein n=1 Tax=Sorangium sp. So ce131 TaxID=3133282 RepID=UPI003F61FEB9